MQQLEPETTPSGGPMPSPYSPQGGGHMMGGDMHGVGGAMAGGMGGGMGGVGGGML